MLLLICSGKDQRQGHCSSACESDTILPINITHASLSVHDGDITAMLGALELLAQRPHLPTSNELHDRAWRMSDVTVRLKHPHDRRR